MIRPTQRAADRTALPNRLKRLHAAVIAVPAKYGFPKWVSRLPIKGRRIKKPKLSGAQGADIREAARVLADEADRLAHEFISQTRPQQDGYHSGQSALRPNRKPDDPDGQRESYAET